MAGVTLTVEAGPDERGKSTFCAEWTDPYGRRRGQYFRTNLDTAVRHWRARGYSVVIMDGGLVGFAE